MEAHTAAAFCPRRKASGKINPSREVLSGAADTRAGDRDGPGALRALLVPALQACCCGALLSTGWCSSAVPVAVATDQKTWHSRGTTNSLTEDNFGAGASSPKVGLDNGDRSWQLEHC